MLAAQIDEPHTEGLQVSESCQLSIDRDSMLASVMNGALDEEPSVLALAEPKVRESFANGWKVLQVKYALHDSFVAAASDQRTRGSASEKECDGLNDDRFACARFSGEDIESCLEGNFRRINDGEISNLECFEHQRTPNCGSVSCPDSWIRVSSVHILR